MKTKLWNYIKIWWRVLTVVPGWADAPLLARCKRAGPIVLPVVAIVMIMSWNFAYASPRANAVKEQLIPLLKLEAEISALHMTTSRQQLAELTESTVIASRLLVAGPKELPAFLKQLKERIQKSGWDATFQIAEVNEDNPTADRLQITYLPVRAKFKPQVGNQDPFGSLLPMLEQLSLAEKRIDLTRVAIRVDETRWQPVEVNFRLICPLLDEKTL